MSNKKPFVSVIMPSYNSEDFIDMAIQSVLLQTFSDLELIVIDDCSTDFSYKVAMEYSKADKRVIVFKNSENKGAAFSRNYGISKSKGRMIAFLDSDDFWEKEKLEKQISFMLKENVALSYSDYYVLRNGSKKVFSARKNLTYKKLLSGCDIGCLTAIYDTSLIGKIYMPEKAVKREDFATWLLIFKKGCKVQKTENVLASYRIHKNSVSKNKIRMIKYQWNVYRNIEHISIFFSLLYLLKYSLRKIFLKY